MCLRVKEADGRVTNDAQVAPEHLFDDFPSFTKKEPWKRNGFGMKGDEFKP